MNLKIPNIVNQNRASNLPNHPKKTEPQTRFVPSLVQITNPWAVRAGQKAFTAVLIYLKIEN